MTNLHSELHKLHLLLAAEFLSDGIDMISPIHPANEPLCKALRLLRAALQAQPQQEPTSPNCGWVRNGYITWEEPATDKLHLYTVYEPAALAQPPESKDAKTEAT